jgi:glycosyltransferase involved in cell wall biosynthesis
MRKLPSIVSIDATQDILLDASRSALERWTYRPSVAHDGRIFRAACAIVSTSDWAAGCIRRRYPGLVTPIHVMPSPVRLQFFDDRWAEERLSRAASRPDYRPHVLFVGGDFVRKGGEDLLAVWRAEHLDRHAQLNLVTDAPVRADAFHGVRVISGVTPYSAEWSALWHAADIFVLPTRQDAFANVFQEAAAAGLPRIGTRSQATPEMITDGESGLLVPPRDHAALAGALRRLIESPSLRRDFGQAARARVIKTSSPDGYREKLRAIIRDSAAKASAARVRRGHGEI